jgi:hypothetical protein
MYKPDHLVDRKITSNSHNNINNDLKTSQNNLEITIENRHCTQNDIPLY